MWETDPNKKPSDDGYRLCGNRYGGSFMARWNGHYWSGEPYTGADDYWIADRVTVDAWLKTPMDQQTPTSLTKKE